MTILSDGSFQFNSMGEMYHNLFMMIGLGINGNQYLYDQDSGNILKFKDKYIKASIDDSMPLYAGMTDIVFEPARNYALTNNIVGYYIDKESNSEDGDRIGYISLGIEDKDVEWHSAIVQTKKKGTIQTRFYRQAYLALLEVIFDLEGVKVDFTNLDEMTYERKN